MIKIPLLQKDTLKFQFWIILLLLIVACSPRATNTESVEAPPSPLIPTEASTPESSLPEDDDRRIVLQNQGGNMEGHTPRGFQGMGTGLFTGDNLNPRFPEGDGVQIFLTFDLHEVPSGEIVSAVLRSDNVRIKGTPFGDLGVLIAEEIRYEAFSPALWDLVPEPGGASCDFATSPQGPFACDLTTAVNRSRDDGYRYAQFRLRMTEAGDSDGTQDMIFFFITEPNTNQPGIFELELDVEAAEGAVSASPADEQAANSIEEASPIAQTLATGEFELAAATAFGEPGFHDVFQLVHDLPPDLGSTAGQRLIVTLQDISRPGQTCSSEHPLSGCATLDWSDGESRPKVPPGGVFDNSLTVELASGPHTFFLSETGILADTPDAYDPG